MPFEPGNQLAKNRGGTKDFRDALMLALKRTDGDKVKLARVAERLVDEAENGNVAAIKEIADRIDGKPAQAVTLAGDDEGGPMKLEIIRRIVDPNPGT